MAAINSGVWGGPVLCVCSRKVAAQKGKLEALERRIFRGRGSREDRRWIQGDTSTQVRRHGGKEERDTDVPRCA